MLRSVTTLLHTGKVSQERRDGGYGVGMQWWRQEFSFGGTIAQRVSGGSRREDPVGGLGDEVPQKLNQFADVAH